MNATNGTVTQPTGPQLKPTDSNYIAVELDAEIQKKACGLITMWSCTGEVTVDALTAALKNAGSSAIAPDAPSALVALNRAVAAVAKTLGHLDVHHKGRGEWAIVGKGVEDTNADGKKIMAYPIDCVAKVERGKDGSPETLTVEGRGADEIRAAYARAKTLLAPTDIGTWLCDKLRTKAIGGVPLRDRGGVYFVPRGIATERWNKIVAALKTCSHHKVYTIYSMKSTDAVEAIIAALTEDTQQACAQIDEDVAKLGDKGLKNREAEMATMFERIDTYEALLGSKLDDLRAAVERTRAAVATARLTLASAVDDAE